MLDASTLLERAAARYDGDARVSADARAALFGGFGAGLSWMARRSATVPSGSGAWLGLKKYGACAIAAALVAAAIVYAGGASLVSLVAAAVAWIGVFYAIESRWVFVFPAAAYGEPHPFAASRALVQRHGGTLASMRVVLPIAASMLFGGFIGRGFLRSWCIGCLAVLVWYELLVFRRSRCV